jgi:hypothetical protein
MNLRNFAILSVSVCALGACLAAPSARATTGNMLSQQVECDDVYWLCVSMGYDEQFCSELAIRMCSVGGDDGNPP